MDFSRIAVLGRQRSADYLQNWIGAVKEVYLISPSEAVIAEMVSAGFAVHSLQSMAEIPPDVFRLYDRKGFWGTVHKETGFIRNVSFAENSHQAAMVLLSSYAPGFREQFTVEPVDVTLADCPQRASA